MATPQKLRDRVAPQPPVDLPADGSGLRWRRIRVADARAVHALERMAGLIDHPHSVIPLEEIENDLTSDHVDLDRDTILAEDAAGEVVAYGMATLLPAPESLVRVWLSGAVRPDRRSEGIGRRIVEWQDRRGQDHLSCSDAEMPGWLVAATDQRATSTRSLFRRAGFEERRWWLELERDLAGPVEAVPLDPALRLVSFGPEWSEATREARNDVFRDHWGSQPFSVKEWDDLWGLPVARPDLSWLAVDAEGQVVAFVLTDVNEEEWEQFGHSFGYIHYVGVRRAARGRHVAQSLLSTALARYREEGLATAVLDVDSESPTGATGLYEGLGFVPINRSVSLVKEF